MAALIPLLKNKIILACAVNGFFVVALGAFGAHALEASLSEEMIAVYQTGVQYHMFHIVGMLLCLVLITHANSYNLVKWAFISFLSGIIIFCGSLYVLAVTSFSMLGMITPIGGVLFLVGWFLLAITVLKKDAA